MNEVITFETMPKAMAYLINKVEALEKKLLEKNEVPTYNRQNEMRAV